MVKTSNQNIKIISLEEIADVTDRLISKYDLEKEIEEEETVKKALKDVESLADRRGIKFIYSKKVNEQLKKSKSFSEATPFGRLKKIINEFIEKRINLKDLPLTIEKRLGLSTKKSEQLAGDIQDCFPSFVKKETFENGEESSVKEMKITEKKENIEEKKVVEKKEPVKRETAKKDNFLEKDISFIKKGDGSEDSYREPF